MLMETYPALVVRVEVITTTGDRDTRPFASIGGKGLFTSEVERAVGEERVDVAVHSAKDLTAELAAGCSLICIPERAPAYDVVLGGSGSTGEERLEGLRPGAAVGTSSVRRRTLLAEVRPDVTAVEFRGNLDTRLRKTGEGEVDAAIVAAAGLLRLGHRDLAPLDPERWVPAPAQGALAVEARTERSDLIELFSALDDPNARAEVECERSFAERLEGGCSVPLGCHAVLRDEGLVVSGFLGSPFGGDSFRDRISGPVAEARALGTELAEAILHAGGDEVLAEVAASVTEEVPAP
ncbi:MAG: hydroxymethylbilane synthase [Actinomycetota bacterium]|jgi:hydroxymethylbilane synthase|nr:hydroxymethylbilane synthase [Actinomycetota bacterium]